MAGRTRSLELKIAAVVRNGNCSGCGACCQLDGGLEMALDGDGYLRPHWRGDSDPASAAGAFESVCPGRTVSSPRTAGAVPHPTMGPSVAVWSAAATDPELRHRGSSGGVISALSRWLLGEGRATTVVAAAVSPDDPTRTATVTVTSPDAIAATAGSRYAPVGNASAATPDPGSAVFVGKPCEVAAVRALAERTGDEPPLLISFFCAGTPSQHATDALVADLGNGRPPSALWYRGRGWPGSFTVVNDDDTTAELDYERSWGAVLGPTTQWRCKICVDGIGESADIVAADFWDVDERGYPSFGDRPGVSALIARTERGRRIVDEAVAAGAIEVRPASLDDLARAQPLQVKRRRTLPGRLLGAVLAGRAVPRYRGFGLLAQALRAPVLTLRTARQTLRRARADRRRKR